MDWVSGIAHRIRDSAASQPWLAAIEPSVRQTPDWALVGAAPAFAAALLLLVFVMGPRGQRKPKLDRVKQQPATRAEPATSSPVAPPKPSTAIRTSAATPQSATDVAAPISSRPRPADDEDHRSVRVFVSSTFLDMQSERDILVKEVFPALRARMRARSGAV